MPAPREMAETKYVAVGDADVAYRVMGDGPFDLLYFYGLGSHVDMHSDDRSETVSSWMRWRRSAG